MAEFDLSTLMKDVSVPDTGRDRIEYIDVDLIDPDPDNFYSLDGIDELAGNIEMLGLQQPLRVRPAQGGRFTVISGHRRRAAILLIRDGGSKQFAEGVPCIVDRSEASDALRELRLIMANSDTRKMTSADQSRQAERIEDLLRQLEDEGYEFPGRLRDWVSKLSGMSRTKLARLSAIRNNLAPGLLSFYESGSLNETAAYELQQLPPEAQEEIAASCKRSGNAGFITARGVEHCQTYAERYMTPCKCGDGDECDHHARRFVQTLRTEYSWARCTGDCCLSCSELRVCQAPCAKARAKRQTEKDKEKAAEEKRKAKREREEAERQAHYRIARHQEAQRLLPLFEAAGIDGRHTLPGRYSYADRVKLSDIKKAAAGDFGTSHFYDSSLLPSSVKELTEWADALDCSLDYLAGRTDEPKAAAESDTPVQWQRGADPQAEGRYLCLVDMNTTTLHEQRCDWKDGAWYAFGQPMRDLFTVLAWWPLPDEAPHPEWWLSTWEDEDEDES